MYVVYFFLYTFPVHSTGTVHINIIFNNEYKINNIDSKLHSKKNLVGGDLNKTISKMTNLLNCTTGIIMIQ